MFWNIKYSVCPSTLNSEIPKRSKSNKGKPVPSSSLLQSLDSGSFSSHVPPIQNLSQTNKAKRNARVFHESLVPEAGFLVVVFCFLHVFCLMAVVLRCALVI